MKSHSINLVKGTIFTILITSAVSQMNYSMATFVPPPGTNFSACCIPESLVIKPDYNVLMPEDLTEMTATYNQEALNNSYCHWGKIINESYSGTFFNDKFYFSTSYADFSYSFEDSAMDTSDSDAVIEYVGGMETSCTFTLIQSASTEPLGQWIITDGSGCVPQRVEFSGDSSSFQVEFDFSDSYLETNTWCIEGGITDKLIMPLRTYIDNDNSPVWVYKSSFSAGYMYSALDERVPTIMAGGIYNETSVFSVTLVSANISNSTFGAPSGALWVNSPNNNPYACCIPVQMTTAYTGQGTWNATLEYDSSDYEDNSFCQTAGIQGNVTGTIFQMSDSVWVISIPDVNYNEMFDLALNISFTTNESMSATLFSNWEKSDNTDFASICSFELAYSNIQPNPNPNPNPKPNPNSSSKSKLDIYFVLSFLFYSLFL